MLHLSSLYHACALLEVRGDHLFSPSGGGLTVNTGDPHAFRVRQVINAESAERPESASRIPSAASCGSAGGGRCSAEHKAGSSTGRSDEPDCTPRAMPQAVQSPRSMPVGWNPRTPVPLQQVLRARRAMVRMDEQLRTAFTEAFRTAAFGTAEEAAAAEAAGAAESESVRLAAWPPAAFNSIEVCEDSVLGSPGSPLPTGNKPSKLRRDHTGRLLTPFSDGVRPRSVRVQSPEGVRPRSIWADIAPAHAPTAARSSSMRSSSTRRTSLSSRPDLSAPKQTHGIQRHTTNTRRRRRPSRERESAEAAVVATWAEYVNAVLLMRPSRNALRKLADANRREKERARNRTR